MAEADAFLNLTTKPALLDYGQAAWMTGLTDKQIAIAVSKKLIKTVGKPVPNCRKYLSRKDMEELANDRPALDRIVNAIYQSNRDRNNKQKAIDS